MLAAATSPVKLLLIRIIGNAGSESASPGIVSCCRAYTELVQAHRRLHLSTAVWVYAGGRNAGKPKVKAMTMQQLQKQVTGKPQEFEVVMEMARRSSMGQ